MKSTSIAAAVGAALVISAAALAQPAAPPPAPVGKNIPVSPALAPTKLSGLGINVTDLDKMRDFYTQVLGFKVIRQIPATGAPNEYVLNLKADGSGGANLVLLKSAARREGAATYGRIILYVPNAEAMAKQLTDNGWPARKVGSPTDRAYFIRDPEGNNFEIYQP